MATKKSTGISVTLPSSQLKSAVIAAARTAEDKTSLPILTNVVITVDDAGLSLRTTDLKMSTLVKAHVTTADGYGSTCVNARDLASTVKKLPDCTLKITAAANHALTIEAVGRKLKIRVPGMDAEDFPAAITVAGEPQSIEPALFKRLIDATRFAISNDDTRPHLAALRLHKVGKLLRAVATDGHRLALAESEWPGHVDALVPFRGVSELLALCEGKAVDGKPSELRITVDDRHVLAESGGVALTLKLADAQFPPYDKVIPKSWTTTTTLPREELIGALNRMSDFTDGKRGDGVRLVFADGELTVQAENPDKGEGAETLPATHDGEQAKAVGVSARYLREAVTAITHDDVTIYSGGELDPLLVMAPESSADRNTRQVCMPMRI